MEEKKQYKILKTVQGSEDGITVKTFNKGEVLPIGADLAEQLYHQGAVEEVAAEEPQTAANRSTKVTGPKETKVVAPEENKEGEAGVDTDTQHIEELVALARDHYGLDVDSTMGEEEVRKLIDAAEEAGPATTAKTDSKRHKKPAKGKR